jgi:membrane fusion protein (multidrug efflux system)
VLPDRDLEKAEADAQKLHASVTTLQSAVNRIPQEQTTRDRERDIRVRAVQEDLAKLKTEQDTTKGIIDRFAYETERRRIRTPVDGRVAEAEILRTGSVVHEGDRLGSVLAAGNLIVVAEYPANAAFGRIRPGQAATLRLEGFPWEEFGTVNATVSKVAEEASHGEVRVELVVDRCSTFRGSLQHGMPGDLEILIDRQSPLALIARTGGQWLTARR